MSRRLRGWLVQNPDQNNMSYTKSRHYIRDEIIPLAAEKGIELEWKSMVDVNPMVSKMAQGDLEKDLPDFVNLWSKDFILIQMLEMMGVRCFNSGQAIENCKNKALTSVLLLAAKVPQPRFVSTPRLVEPGDWNVLPFVDELTEYLGLPIVGKKCQGSFGEEVQLLHDKTEVIAFLDSYPPEQHTVFQEFIAESVGRDARLYVVGDEVVAAMERNSANSDEFRANIAAGGSALAFSPSIEEKEVAIAAARAVGCDYAGVDILFGKDGPLICEVNSNAHFKGIDSVSDVRVEEKILDYIIKEMS